MNIISSNQTKNTVSLEQLVPQHDCLKLLILHTPYTLNITTLPLCLNLIKLDLSKNNLQFFPYLGHLRNLKFLFIHENKLDIVQLRGIFQENQQKSYLSFNIVWATFWGNKNSFLGRHYLITETSAIAVDKNLVAYEQQSDVFPFFETVAPFDESTDISHLLRKKMINRHATEEQYMSQLWIQLKELRKRHQMIFPIIKIQKWTRGWLVRNRFQKTYQKQRISQQLKQLYFKQWKKYLLNSKKLRQILKKSGKQYLLQKGKQARRKQLQMKAIEWARNAKRRIILKKIRFSNQLKIYNLIRQNYLTLKSLYQSLELKRSSAVYIHRNSWASFQKHVIPIIERRNRQKVVPTANKRFLLQTKYECSSQITSQFVKIMNVNMKSTIFEVHQEKPAQKKMKRFTQRLNLKKIYQPFHLPTKRYLQLKELQRNLSQKQEYGFQDLVKVQGTYLLLKDITQSIYFYNISNRQATNYNHIDIFSEAMMKKVVCAVKIQKVWRGFNFRKRNQKYLKVVLKMQRAAIIIQRWSRKLRSYHKKYFMINITKELAKIQEKNWFIEMSDYLSLVRGQSQKKKSIFLQQDCSIYLNKQSQMICLGWNYNSTEPQVQTNIHMGKIIFSQPFFKKTIGISEEQISAKVKYSNTMVLSDFSHLFHYQTTSTTVKKQNRNYLCVTFSSKFEAKFRYLILKLLTYSYKNTKGVKIMNSIQMGNYDLCKQIKVQNLQHCVFICNQNLNLIKFCEEKLTHDTFKIHLVANKFYVKGEKKVTKMQQKFVIFISQTQQEQIPQVQNAEVVQNTQEKRYRSQLSNSFINNRDVILREQQIQIQANYEETVEQSKLKKILNKRSMKQYKIDKRIKHRKNNPSFILDSISINDKLTTQPDYLPTHQSNLQDSNIPKEKAPERPQSIQAETRPLKKQIKPPKHPSFVDKSKALSKRKQDQSFIRRFVNIGNFIQNQFAGDHRRRIKTQGQHSAIQSAQNIKRSFQRSQSQRIQQAQQKLKIIKQRHSQHRQIVTAHEQASKQKFEKMKNQVRQERQKRVKDKGKVKRLKVSFAQQCYPLANRSQKTEYFP